jgi:hypothetical protein
MPLPPPHVVDAHPGSRLSQDETGGLDVEHGEVGDDPLHARQAGQRQRALAHDLVPPAPGGVLHHHQHPLGAVDEVHRAAHPLDHLPGDHPVGEVAFLRDLHRAEHRDVDVPSADHRERAGGVEERGARQDGDRLLAGVDEVGVDLLLRRVRADAQHAVLAVQDDVHAVRHVVRDQGGQPDPQVDDGAVGQLARDPRGQLVSGEGHG